MANTSPWPTIHAERKALAADLTEPAARRTDRNGSPVGISSYLSYLSRTRIGYDQSLLLSIPT